MSEWLDPSAIETWWSIPLKGIDKLSLGSYWNPKQSDDILIKAEPALLYPQQLYLHRSPTSCTLAPLDMRKQKMLRRWRKMSVQASGWPAIFLLLLPLVSSPSFDTVEIACWSLWWESIKDIKSLGNRAVPLGDVALFFPAKMSLVAGSAPKQPQKAIKSDSVYCYLAQVSKHADCLAGGTSPKWWWEIHE